VSICRGLVIAAFCLLAVPGSARATEDFVLSLHQRVQASDTIVVARVIDAERALLRVERVLKGDPPARITLVAYIDGFLRNDQRKPLVQNARELIFLNRRDGGYAPLQTQFGRFAISGDRMVDPVQDSSQRLSDAIASIQRLVQLQARAARGASAADRALVAAFRSTDPLVLEWALDVSNELVKAPSDALANAMIAHWPEHLGEVANAMLVWRLRRAAPVFAKSLTDSADGDVRAYAAMSLGGTGDRTHLDLLRRVSSSDAYPLARALAYDGIMYMIGPEALADLRLGAKDSHESVRAQAVVDAYNMLELESEDRRFPPASSALIDDVVAFLAAMQSDPARLVSDNAKSMLAYIARHRR
jgi:HEAT repeat protein